jgi:hypothetical protein
MVSCSVRSVGSVGRFHPALFSQQLISRNPRASLSPALRGSRSSAAPRCTLHAEDPLLAHAARAAGVDISRETRDELGAFRQSAAPAADGAPLHASRRP